MFANGLLYFDDGDTTDHKNYEDYLLVNFTYQNNILKSELIILYKYINYSILHQTKNMEILNTIERIIVVAPALEKSISKIIYKFKLKNQNIYSVKNQKSIFLLKCILLK